MNHPNEERLMDLLAERAVQPLSEVETQELERLLRRFAETDETQFERAAAAIQLTEAMKPEALPSHLKTKLIADAQRFFGNEDSAREEAVAASNVITFPRLKRSPWQWAGWYAAAACLLLALWAGWPRVQELLRGKSPAPSLADIRSRLRQQAKDAVQSNWSPTKYPGVENVQGDVVWSNEKQEGYMRFVNLAANNPDQSVYQLWIFDANQDEKYPVDGGVFNVAQTGEVIVPIRAKLNVAKPTLFAVTIEKPGGVVVSKRDKLILTAKVG